MTFSEGDRAKAKRLAVITGAAQGIGQRTAELLAERGWRLALLDLQSCRETVNAAKALGADVLEFTGNVCDESFVTGCAEDLAQRWSAPDVVVNNAGISFICAGAKTSVADFRRVLEVNLVGPFLVMRTFAPLMLAQGSGCFVNVASIAGIAGVADRGAYNASKHGLVGLTRTLAAEWGGRGVRCNAVCPGWVKTAMDDVEQARGTYTDSDITNRVPMGRFASTDDIAHAIAFLADSSESGFVNGHTLVVDGGWTADASWESLRLSQRSR
jgi:NAD(P)-dependent dehydrogenase (short-subunit alcohol dehydrogenase family)